MKADELLLTKSEARMDARRAASDAVMASSGAL